MYPNRICNNPGATFGHKIDLETTHLIHRQKTTVYKIPKKKNEERLLLAYFDAFAES